MADDFMQIRENIGAWKESKEVIGEYFQKRETKLAKEPMMMFTEKFMESLLLLNHQKPESIENKFAAIKNLDRKPLNTEERLAFVIDAPNHYHSYIQLKELFVELEKLAAKFQVIESRNK